MFLNEFNQTQISRVASLNKMLSKEFGIKINPGTVNLTKLMKINETAKKALYKIRGSKKKFQLEPEYAKYLGLKDISETMIVEGYYESSPGYQALEAKIYERVMELCNSGYMPEEARSQCMNEVRKDSSHCYDDNCTEMMVMSAIKKFEESCGMKHDESIEEAPVTDLSPALLRELSKEMGMDLATMEDYGAIEERLNGFAEVSGKSRDAVVGFLNGLEENSVVGGIQMFGRKIAEMKLNDSIQYMHKLQADGKSVEEIAKELKMKPEEVRDAMSKTETEESVEESTMFDSIIDELLNEEVNVEEAEVVMAVRALADDIQDQVERIGRMMNEDIPAIADTMRNEMGADVAQSFADATSQLLSAHIEACRGVKTGMDAQIDALAGGQMPGGLGDTADMEMPAEEPSIDDLGMDMEEPVADNLPAMSGPEEEPLGRAEV
jgi:hypothetical protein